MYFVLVRSKSGQNTPWGLARAIGWTDRQACLESARTYAQQNINNIYRVLGTQVEMSANVTVEETNVR